MVNLFRIFACKCVLGKHMLIVVHCGNKVGVLTWNCSLEILLIIKAVGCGLVMKVGKKHGDELDWIFVLI